MVVYTLEQRWGILRHYFKNHGNVAECVRILEKEEHRQLPMFIIFKKKLASFIDANQNVKSQKQCVHKMCLKSNININSLSFSTIVHFVDIIEANFTKRPWYDAIQSPIVPRIEAN